ncbi:MAG: hypothetical protein OXU36_13960 [Candidatus Poribacteria bacterium]|nr:hypothetical protein [Candidatus Poribacteria bacterium]
MFKLPFVFGVCLVLGGGCLFANLSRLGAAPQPRERPQETPQPAALTEIQSVEVAEVSGDLFSDSISSDFYQTILKNNLFAPLGTNLHAKPVPGANVLLIATFTTQDPFAASAIVKNTATGEQQTVGLGTVIWGYRIAEIQYKQILLEKDGAPAIWKFLKPTFLD